MMQKRDSSYTLCKGLIKKVLKKHISIGSIKIDILEIDDHNVKAEINIDNLIRTFDIVLDKTKRKINPNSMNNIKKQKINDKNKHIKKDSNVEVLELDIPEKKIVEKEIDVNIEKTHFGKNEDIDNIHNINIKNEKCINKKINMDHHNTPKNQNDESLISENKKLINEENNDINPFYDDSEPEDEYDHEDPHFTKYPDEFLCHNCYETNVEKKELFDYAQQMTDKNDILNNEIKKLKEDIVNKNKLIKEYKNKNYSQDENIDFITGLNDNFMELFLITHNSFNSIKNILLILEKANPKKVPEILNKNINNYKKEIQSIADEADKVRNNHLDLSSKIFGDKIKNN
jgi:hypothetical protein